MQTKRGSYILFPVTFLISLKTLSLALETQYSEFPLLPPTFTPRRGVTVSDVFTHIFV